MARLSTDGTKIIDNYDRFTGVPFNATKVTKWVDGTTMNDSKVDNAIYFKNKPELGGGYAKRDYEGNVDIRWFGTIGDGINDCGDAINKAMIALGALGGTILIPAGRYKIVTPIILRKNICLTGIGQFNIETNNAGNRNTVILAFEPSSPNTDLFTTDVPQGGGYISGISISNLAIEPVNHNCRHAINANSASNLLIDRIVVSKSANGSQFVDALIFEYLIDCKISNCILKANNSTIRFTGNISTSTVIDQCYLTGASWAAIIETGAALLLTFKDCIFETCTEGAVDVYVDNLIDFISCYSENIPSTPSAKPILQFGINGTPVDPAYPKLEATVVGGSFSGCNFGVDVGSSFVSTGTIKSLSLLSTKSARNGVFIKTTANTKLVSVIGGSCLQTANLKSGITDLSKVTFLSFSHDNLALPELTINKIQFNNRNKWSIEESFSQTDGDLIFRNGSNNRLWLDNNLNIRHSYTGSAGSMNSVDAFGAVLAPNFTGVAALAAMWAQLLNSSVVFRIRNSDNNLSTLGDLRGPTANLPTEGLYPGLRYFDTTLNSLFIYNGSAWISFILNQTAVDQTGAFKVAGNSTNNGTFIATGAGATPLTAQRTSSGNIAIEVKNTSGSWYWGKGSDGSWHINTSPALTAGSSMAGKTTGEVGINNANPTSAWLHIGAGTTTLAPLRFTSGTLLTTPVAGTIEFLIDKWYGTISTGVNRKTFAFLEDPAFTGIPTANTAAVGTNTAQIATTAFIQQEILADRAINTTTTPLSSATLNDTYPNVKVGFRVICYLITGAPTIYTKATENGTSDVWLAQPATIAP